MPRLLISAAHKSSGKTTVTIGLCAALRERGHTVQPFKKGPDYIDPLWLGEAAGRACYNLDFYTQSEEEIRTAVSHYSRSAEISLIEGNKGLYDGLDLHGGNSNAALARLLDTPVVLVLDTRGMTRGVAPLVLGYQSFEKDLRIRGVILNQVGGPRHESKLRAVLEHYTDMPVLGAVRRDAAMEIVERHLGLMPSNENQAAREKIAQIAARIAEQVDLDALMRCAAEVSPLPAPASCGVEARPADLRIGIIRDAAFAFYYPDDLETLRAAGAELVFINALRDPHLPAVDALFIGGGFPETHMHELAANHSLKQDIRAAVHSGLPVYAECGGLMYLARRLYWNDETAEMSGALPLDTRMQERPLGRGYVQLEETGAGLWRHSQGGFNAHEFHYSKVENAAPGLQFAYKVLRGYGVDGGHDGILYKNTLACYTHQRDTRQNPWCRRFVEFVRSRKTRA